jgi:hypothetical protein
MVDENVPPIVEEVEPKKAPVKKARGKKSKTEEAVAKEVIGKIEVEAEAVSIDNVQEVKKVNYSAMLKKDLLKLSRKE